MTSPSEQFGFYASIAVSIYGSYTPIRKAYFLNKYIHAKEPDVKLMYAGRMPFTQHELDAAELYIKEFNKVPRRYSLIPIGFLVFEFGKNWYKGFFKKSK